MPNQTAPSMSRGATRSGEAMRPVCCWCAPAHAERLSMRNADKIRFGICEDCLEERLSDLAVVTPQRRAHLTAVY